MIVIYPQEIKHDIESVHIHDRRLAPESSSKDIVSVYSFHVFRVLPAST
jgi:hypothetical protein